MKRLAGKVTVVTGAAGGIGRSIAALFLREGAFVQMADIDAEGLSRAQAELGGSTSASRLDVRDERAWRSLFGELLQRHGRVDVLVNNAGVTGNPQAGDLESVTLEDWRDVQSANVESVLLGCRHFVTTMASRGGGSIVNISSMAALTATPSLLAYGASKAAVRQLTQSVAMHCLRKGHPIRCNSVHPGFIETDMVRNAFAPERLDQLKSSIPVGSLGTAADIAQAVLYFASDESRYATGTRLVVDGGVTLR